MLQTATPRSSARNGSPLRRSIAPSRCGRDSQTTVVVRAYAGYTGGPGASRIPSRDDRGSGRASNRASPAGLRTGLPRFSRFHQRLPAHQGVNSTMNAGQHGHHTGDAAQGGAAPTEPPGESGHNLQGASTEARRARRWRSPTAYIAPASARTASFSGRRWQRGPAPAAIPVDESGVLVSAREGPAGTPIGKRREIQNTLSWK